MLRTTLRAATGASSFPRSAPGRSLVGAFLRRDWSITRSYRLPFILDGFYGLLQLAVYYFISRALPDASSSELSGAPSYFAFAAVGMVVTMVVDSASEGLAYRVREEQLSGSLEALMTEPLSSKQICAGFTAFPFAFAFVRAALYLLIAGVWLHLDLTRTDWLGVVVVFVTAGMALASLGILAGAVVLVVKRGVVLAGMALFAMTLLSGAVFPVSSLPGWLAAIGEVLPLRFAYDGAREALFKGSGWGPEVLTLVGFTVVGLPLAIWVFGRALDWARRAGSLGQY
jgi:ABC-2 type transport system permease protein